MRNFLPAGIACVALLSGSCCRAQPAPVPVKLHVTDSRGGALHNESIMIAPDTSDGFSRYRSDAQGNITISMAPGQHQLRVLAHGYPMTSVPIDVSAPVTLTVALGHGTSAKAQKPAPGARTETAAKSAKPAPAAPSKPATKSPPPVPATKASAPEAETTAPALDEAPARHQADPLKPYTSCYFPDGLQIQSIEPLAAGVTSRSVETADGPQRIDLKAGTQVLFAFPFTDFFANARAEELPAASYRAEKKALLANLAYMESQPGGPAEASPLPDNLHGFEVRGDNREKFEGSVLGMYLLFDDPAHVVTTVSFLNQASGRRAFQTMDEYAGMRDQFLVTYTECVRVNQAIEQ
jgi:hypothetical protein